MKRTTETAWPRIPSHIANTAAAGASFLQLQCEKLPLRTTTLKVTVFLHQQNKNLKKMQHCSKRSSFAEKVTFPKKKKRKEKRDLTTSTWHSFSHWKRCSLRFSLPLQREKLPFGLLLASPRFSLQLQDFAAVSMETAALHVQKAKSCSRVTRALETESQVRHSVQQLSYLDFSFRYHRHPARIVGVSNNN